MSHASPYARRAKQAFLECERGLAAWPDDEPESRVGQEPAIDRAWSCALRALRWSFDPSAAVPPRPADIVQLSCGAAAEPREPALLACSVMARASLMTFDNEGLAAWAALERDLSGGQAGHGDGFVEPSRVGTDSTAGPREPRLVIENAILRSLTALADDRIDEALELSRRAFLMARAEELPQLEWLAGLVLARVRRRAGHPHLALYILTALARVASPILYGWIGWEMLLSGGESGALALIQQPATGLAANTPALRAARALATLLASARAGNREAFDLHVAAVEGAVAGLGDVAREAEAVFSAVDAARPPPITLSAWSRGRKAELPFGLYGLGLLPKETSEPSLEVGTIAFIVGDPAQAGRRILRPGLGIAPADELPKEEGADVGGARTETGIAVLLLAGPGGVPRDEFFGAVYGFPFVFDLHDGTLEVLIHRMRVRLGRAGEINRAEDPPRIRLDLHRRIRVPDVRCTLPVADRLLRVLAVTGPSGSAAAAETLALSARTVQRVLHQLVNEGTCSVVRAGRQLVYKVEDTVFTHITSVSQRMKPADTAF